MNGTEMTMLCFSASTFLFTTTLTTTKPKLPLQLTKCNHHHHMSIKRMVNTSRSPWPIHAYPPNKQQQHPSSSTSIIQSSLWLSEAAYVLCLFLLPYAPGDPVWAISPQTLTSLIDLSLNFFLILPLLNSAGVHLIQAPLQHPVSEGLFNFVIGWTFMFAPLLFTDRRRDRYRASLDLLWGLQMFLTNTFLIPYMAIRLNSPDPDYTPRQTKLGSLMTSGAGVVGVVRGFVCLVSLLWGLFGRGDADFGGVTDRWSFLIAYIGSERLAYAFVWDICFYTVFQPWLIGDNLQNVDQTKTGLVDSLRFVPVIGLVAYLVCLKRDHQQS